MNRSPRSDLQRQRDSELLPWKTIPTWLRCIRVLAFVAWTTMMLTLTSGFVLQHRVFESPSYAVGEYQRPVEYKGRTYYLTGETYRIWTFLNSVMTPCGLATFGLIIVNGVSERRIKARRWESQLTAMIEHMDRDWGRRHRLTRASRSRPRRPACH